MRRRKGLVRSRLTGHWYTSVCVSVGLPGASGRPLLLCFTFSSVATPSTEDLLEPLALPSPQVPGFRSPLSSPKLTTFSQPDSVLEELEGFLEVEIRWWVSLRRSWIPTVSSVHRHPSPDFGPLLRDRHKVHCPSSVGSRPSASPPPPSPNCTFQVLDDLCPQDTLPNVLNLRRPKDL